MTKAKVNKYNGTKSLNFEKGGIVNAFPASDMKKGLHGGKRAY